MNATYLLLLVGHFLKNCPRVERKQDNYARAGTFKNTMYPAITMFTFFVISRVSRGSSIDNT